MTTPTFKDEYAEVNGLRMYYEIYAPEKLTLQDALVLIHGGGSTIQTTFGNLIPLLSSKRPVIAMELQAHGRTSDRPADLSFKQDADDVISLLQHLKVEKAHFFGFSNGGQTVIEIALRHPDAIHKIIIASAFYKRSAASPQFWEGFNTATIEAMPPALKEGFLKANPDETAFLNMFHKDVQRMKTFEGWSGEQIKSIQAPALIINGNQDVGSIEHAVEMHRLLRRSQLLVLPGKHGEYMGAAEYLENGAWAQQYIADIINNFLDGNRNL